MEIGTQKGPYRIDALIGQGGMAQVYKVWHQDLHCYRALKALSPALAADRAIVERFLREARIAAGLQHPNIATIYSLSEPSDAQPYFVMELLEGDDLTDLINERGPMSLDEALPIIRQIAAALDCAHDKGLIHGDLKPANILFKGGDKQVKVVDFGVAQAQQAAGADTILTRGRPEYISPEEAGSGAPIGTHADQYRLGLIAYEMLCGELPFREQREAGGISELMSHVREAPRAPRELAPKLYKSTDAAILRALAKTPDERFASCGEFVDALGSNHVAAAVPKYTAPTPARMESRTKSFPFLPVALGALLFVGAGAVGWSALHKSKDGEIEVVAPVATPFAATEALAQVPTPEPTAAPTLVSVPQIVGKTEAQAREILKANGLAVDVTTGNSNAFDAQQVMGQSPAPGSQIRAGAPVRIRISLGSAEKPETRVVRRSEPVPEETISTEGDGASQSDSNGYSFSDPQWPGELFPQVRLRILDRDEVDAMRYAKVRYAINEAYARRGLTFKDRFIQAVFDKKSWYRGDRSRTAAQIDAEFSDIETANIRLLAAAKEEKSE